MFSHQNKYPFSALFFFGGAGAGHDRPGSGQYVHGVFMCVCVVCQAFFSMSSVLVNSLSNGFVGHNGRLDLAS
jgi:hypothetical protein